MTLPGESRRPAHPLADLIPAMDGEEYARLRDDIAANGLLDAITLYEGQVLDGRHRQRACDETATELRFVEYDGDSPAQFVLSHNLHRRHLSKSQLAMIATDFLPHLEAEAAQRRVDLGREAAIRQHHGGSGPLGPNPPDPPLKPGDGRSNVQAGQAVGVSGTSVKRAKRVAMNAPELVEAIRAGDLTVVEAENIVKAKANGQALPKPETGHVTGRSIQRIAEQAASLEMAVGAIALTKSCSRLTADERADAIEKCKKGRKAINALVNALLAASEKE